MILGAWNVRTLLDREDRPERRTALLARTLGKYNIDIDALSENRLADESQLVEVGASYIFYWIGKPSNQPRHSGVGFAIRNTIACKLDSLPKGINDRLMVLQISLADDQYAKKKNSDKSSTSSSY